MYRRGSFENCIGELRKVTLSNIYILKGESEKLFKTKWR